MRNKKVLLSAALVVSAVSSALAQGNGLAGINDATNMVTSYFDPGTKLIYAIGAVVGLIGGIKVYNKFSSGDPDTSKTAASWFGACIFLIVSATVLRSFFPVSVSAMKYTINKGIGRSVEFKGLKAQYLFLFAGGLLAVFVLLVIFYTAGADQWACIGFGAGAASALVFYTFRMNAKYGEHGLMKLAAARRRPRYLINRKGACRFLNRRKEVRHA